MVPQVSLTGISDKGEAVGRNKEGEVFFVERAVPGDVVDVLVLNKKKGVSQGIPTVYHEYSTDRVEPFCGHFSVCGGCKWQHLTYKGQLEHKEHLVRNVLKRIAKVEPVQFLPILGAPETQYYRNKLQFTFSNKKWLTNEELASDMSNLEDVLGYHKAGAFDKIIDIDHCYLQGGLSNELRTQAKAIAREQGLSFYDVRYHTGFMRNITIRTSQKGETMLIVVFGEPEMEKITNYLDALLERFPQLTSIYYCINTKVNDYIMDLDHLLYAGKPYIVENLGEINFRIGPKSFFQTNSGQAVQLFDVVKDFAGLSGQENVYDLYTGIGSIALYIASECRQVVGIEEVEDAIKDAHINRERNGIDNAIFYVGNVKDILSDDFANQHGRPDVVITDPPRAGMHLRVVKTLLQLEAPKIVYVSCNPATQARDLSWLKQKYAVAKVQPVDMFPHTHHIENVVLLTLLPEDEWNKEQNDDGA